MANQTSRPATLRGTSRQASRLLAGALGTSLTLGLVPPVGAAAATTVPTARSIDSAVPPGRTPDSDLRDVQGTSFEREIDGIWAWGLDVGITDDRYYRPADIVDRAEMATFLANLLRAGGRNRPSDLPNAFPDDDASPHRANIDWLARLGIVRGRSDGTYGPDEPVTRAQLASFVNRVIAELTGSPLRSSIDWFADDQGSVHERSINGLAGEGIVTGIGPDVYMPAGIATHGQMAGFLARTLAELVDGGHLVLPFGPKALTVSPTDTRTLQVSDNSATNRRDRGRRDFTVTVPIGIDRVTIGLLPAAQVIRDATGRFRFTSNQLVGRQSGVSIEVVNGAGLDQADGSNDVTLVADVRVGQDGLVTFTVDGANAATIVPVVWVDNILPEQNLLDLPAGTSASQPRESLEQVAVGGTTIWALPEPAHNQNLDTGTVREVNAGAGWYTLDTGGSSAADWLIRFSTSDRFAYEASNEPVAGSPGPITRAQFSTWLSPGDRVNPSAYVSGDTRHTIVGDVPAAPSAAAEVRPDGTVRITWGKPSNPVADDRASSYRIERAPTSGSTAGQYKEVGSRSGDQAAEFVDAPGKGGWSYRVVARSVTGTSPASNTLVVSVATQSVPYPVSTGSRVALDTDAKGQGSANRVLDLGDRLEFRFDRVVEIAGNWSIVLQDRDGTRSVLDNLNATPQLSTDGKVLTIHIAAAGPRLVRKGADEVIDISPSSNSASSGWLQVIDAVGIGDANGRWNLPASGVPGAPANGSRVVIDGTGAGIGTPAAPQGHVVLLGGTNRIEFGRDEVQVLGVTDAATGTWRLRLGTAGDWTAPLDATATAAQVQAALEALPGIGTGNVIVTGGPIDKAGLVVSFVGQLVGQDVPLLSVESIDLLTAGGAPAATPVATVTVDGARVLGVQQGDRIRAADQRGIQLAEGVAGVNGRTSLALPSAIVKGDKVLVWLERADGRLSQTVVITAA